MPSPRQLLRQLLRRCGLDVVRYHPQAERARRHFRSHPHVRLARFLEQHRIDLVLDVGANAGQYGRRLRQLGFAGRLISFEPASDAYRQLCERASTDPLWETRHLALGEHDGEGSLNLSTNSQSSSFLNLLPAHLEAAPQAAFAGSETVAVRRLDAVFEELRSECGEQVLLKLDVQGFEPQVLEGARQCLDQIQALQIEMSLVPLYAGETGLAAMVGELEGRGFVLHALDNGFTDPRTGRLLQVDGLFQRPAAG